MRKVNYKQIANVLNGHYVLKKPLIIYGAFGIGKSGLIASASRELATKEGREYVNFFKESAEKKAEVKDNPEKYYSLLDVRMSERDVSDIKGLMSLQEQEEYIKYKTEMWLDYLTKEGSSGIVFFDEFNLACLEDTALIRTKEGVKRIKDIRKGELVLTEDGKFHKVTETFNRLYGGDIYTVNPHCMLPLKATSEHPFLVIDKYRKANKKWNIKRTIGKQEYKFAHSLKIGDYVAMPLIKDTHSSKINEELAELMGYYTAEGVIDHGSKNSSRIGLYFNKTEKDIVDRIRLLVKNQFKKEIRVSLRDNCYNIRFSVNNKQRDMFLSCGKLSKNKRIPTKILYNQNLKILEKYLYGYWRGDGAFVNNKKYSFITFTTISETLALDLQLAIGRFGVVASVNKDNKQREYNFNGRKGVNCGHSYIIRTPNKKIHDIFDLDRQETRKTEFFFEYDNKLWVKIRKINKENKDTMVYNFEVEGNHSYTSNNIISHNCPMVLSNIYKIVYDRIVNDTIMSKDWLILMAGNRDGVDGAYTFSVPKPLRDRASEVELVADFEGWRDWAIDKGLHHSVITYLSNSQSHFYMVDDNDGQKFSTPRGWERVSDFQLSKLSEEDKCECVKSTIGEGVAIQYLKYCELQSKMDLEKVLKNPKEIEKIEDVSIKYLLVGICADRYKNTDKVVDFNKIMDISQALDDSQNAEFVSLLWKLCLNYTKETKKFRNDFMKIKDIKLLEKYKGYIL